MGVSSQFIPLITHSINVVTADKPLLNRRRLFKITLITHLDTTRAYRADILNIGIVHTLVEFCPPDMGRFHGIL